MLKKGIFFFFLLTSTIRKGADHRKERQNREAGTSGPTPVEGKGAIT